MKWFHPIGCAMNIECVCGCETDHTHFPFDVVDDTFPFYGAFVLFPVPACAHCESKSTE
jgi:hypothetical protein